MSIPLIINGQTFEYPVNFDEDWGVNATGWAQAVTNGMLQRAGGNFPLLADVNFGASFGLVSSYFTSRATNPATIGTLRLASADPGVAFRNNANSGNLILTTDNSDNLLYNGHIVGASGSGSVLSITGTANQVIASSPTGNITLSLPQSIATSSLPTFSQLTLGSPSSNTGVLHFDNSANANTVSIFAGTTTPSSYSITLPVNSGSSGQVLSTDGSGVTSWINAAGGGTINAGTTNNIPYYSGSSILSDTGIARTNIFLADGTVSATGAFNLNSHKITNLTNGSSAQDAVAFTQLSSGNAITAGGIASATITTTQIASATILTGNIASGAVTQVQSSTSGASADKTTIITTKSITTTGGAVLIMATATLGGSQAGSGASFFADMSTAVTRGGTSIVGARTRAEFASSAANAFFSPHTIVAVDTPTAGTYTYNFTYELDSGTSPTIASYSLVLVELKV